MKKFICSLAGLLLVFSPYAIAGKVELGKYPQVFQSGDMIVTMLRVGKEKDNTVLIKVDGIDNQHDGQIYKHKKKCDNKRCTSYKFETKEIKGKKRWWTFQSSRSWGEYSYVTFFPPGISKKHGIYKTSRPKGFDPEKFYKEYLGQKALRK